MELYFAQHGDAYAKQEDPDRPLTPTGEDETRRVADALSGAGVSVEEVWSSGKLRADQTASIFAEALAGGEGAVRQRGFLGPNDDPGRAVEAARDSGTTVLLVGHKPYMNRLPSLLLTGAPDSRPVDVRYSGVVALAEDDDGWRLRWYLRPELLA